MLFSSFVKAVSRPASAPTSTREALITLLPTRPDGRLRRQVQSFPVPTTERTDTGTTYTTAADRQAENDNFTETEPGVAYAVRTSGSYMDNI